MLACPLNYIIMLSYNCEELLIVKQIFSENWSGAAQAT